MAAAAETAELHARIIAETMGEAELASVMPPINGDPTGKNLLSMRQFTADDIHSYLDEARVAEGHVEDGIDLLPRRVLTAVMRQESTRTGGSMVSAMVKVGGAGQLISGMLSSSEAKGESLADSWLAFATQADVLGIRTFENYGSAYAAYVIARAHDHGKLRRSVPVINLGDGQNEHPTQTLGDLFTIQKAFGHLDGLSIAVVGDHKSYRAHHSLMIGAAEVGMTVVAVEAAVAPVPNSLAERLGARLQRTSDLDAAMRDADVLYIGRNPDEYKGVDAAELERSELVAGAYRQWRVDHARLQQMSPKAIVLHPRPRRDELHPSVDGDPRMKDVEQMANMIPMRMAILASHLAKSIVQHTGELAGVA